VTSAPSSTLKRSGVEGKGALRQGAHATSASARASVPATTHGNARSLLRLCRFALDADNARRIRVRDRVLDRDACLANVAQPASGIPFETAPDQLP
jgi:hypothetical protein